MLNWFRKLFHKKTMDEVLAEHEAHEKLMPRERYGDKCIKCNGLLAWSDERTCKCTMCGWAREVPPPASDLYPDQPFRCPTCGGLIVEGDKVWTCVGLPDRRAVELVFGARAGDLQGRPACGWIGQKDDYGKVWR